MVAAKDFLSGDLIAIVKLSRALHMRIARIERVYPYHRLAGCIGVACYGNPEYAHHDGQATIRYRGDPDGQAPAIRFPRMQTTSTRLLARRYSAVTLPFADSP
jgi:hypothetical protein